METVCRMFLYAFSLASGLQDREYFYVFNFDNALADVDGLHGTRVHKICMPNAGTESQDVIL